MRTTLAVAGRVLTQLRRDHRTLALLLVVPCVLMTLLWWLYDGSPGDVFDRVAPGLLALIPFIVMFLVTSVTTLRERTSGTLERLLAMPTQRFGIIAGYAIAFGLVATVQALAVVGLCVGLLGLHVQGSVALLGLIAVADGILGTVMGLCVSALARTEFQAVQFMPAFVTPQMLLCGLLRPRDQLPDVLRVVSDVLPLSYAVDGETGVVRGGATGDVLRDLGVIAAFVVVFVALGSLTLRRRTP